MKYESYPTKEEAQKVADRIGYAEAVEVNIPYVADIVAIDGADEAFLDCPSEGTSWIIHDPEAGQTLGADGSWIN